MSKLSVVLPNRNHASLVSRAIRCILEQDRRPDELIIIDDASTDESVAQIKQAVASFDAARVILGERRLGVVARVNQGLSLAAGDYLAFASADDMFAPRFFALAQEALDRWPEAALVSGSCAHFENDDVFLGVEESAMPCLRSCFIRPERAARLIERHGNWIIGGTTIYRTERLREIGGFNGNLGGFADSLAARRLALTYGAVYVPEVFMYWRRDSDSVSGKALASEADQLSVYRHIESFLQGKSTTVFPERARKSILARLRYDIEVASGQSMPWRRDRLIARIAAFMKFRLREATPTLARRADHYIRRMCSVSPYGQSAEREFTTLLQSASSSPGGASRGEGVERR